MQREFKSYSTPNQRLRELSIQRKMLASQANIMCICIAYTFGIYILCKLTDEMNSSKIDFIHEISYLVFLLINCVISIKIQLFMFVRGFVFSLNFCVFVLFCWLHIPCVSPLRLVWTGRDIVFVFVVVDTHCISFRVSIGFSFDHFFSCIPF